MMRTLWVWVVMSRVCGELSKSEAVAETDLVLLATPVGAIDTVLQQMAPALKPDTIVTDAGSVKQSVIDSARAHMQHFENFVPAHPIAGTEHSGVEAGFASLYRGKRFCGRRQGR